MISVVCWLWTDNKLRSPGRVFRPEHVNTLQRMVARHLKLPHRFVCVADKSDGLAPGVEHLATPEAARAAGAYRSPEGERFPSCYRRLWTFSSDAVCMGERLLLVDIDLVVTADLGPVFDRTEEFVGWRPFRDWGRQRRFGGGIYLLSAGTRPHVWEQFDGAPAIAKARRAGFRGSDQAWISYCLGEQEPCFDRDSGIYSIRDMKGTEHRLPADARLVQFNGPVKPWDSKLPWVGHHFR